MIPVNEPLLAGRELDYVSECVTTGWISSAGRFIDQFEKGWATYCGRKYGVAVCNGTVSLQAAVATLDLQPLDEVIMPTFTIISCAQAVVSCGGKPILVDCEPRTWTVDVTQVEAKITPRTRALMPVHIYGHPVDMDPLMKLAKKHGLVVIEDAAEVHGAEYLSQRAGPDANWRRCGSFGEMSSFSFYANKLITTGEGGMIVTDDPALAKRLASLRNLCFQPQQRFYHEELGFNFRMTNLQAALGVAQMERMEEIIAQKQWMGRAYTEALQDIEQLELQVTEPWARSVYWMYGVVLKEDARMDAVEFARRLRQRGVDTRPFFLGMHEQPVFHQRGWYRDERYPVAERIARRGLYLPSGLALTSSQLEQTAETVKQVLRR
ncbi:MAG: DegT/DnrJ/EryC1/StrS family aminotransferase [Verrucomicrobiota bacterium]|nr:DegT/DnrJ/EryC1/StrS family aminotransferase [Verrucomicrobiota bacterium]